MVIFIKHLKYLTTINLGDFRTLQNQTENALVQQQSMLTQTENQLGSTTSRLSMVDSNRQEYQLQINELRSELATLRSMHMAIECEKDQLTVISVSFFLHFICMYYFVNSLNWTLKPKNYSTLRQICNKCVQTIGIKSTALSHCSVNSGKYLF